VSVVVLIVAHILYIYVRPGTNANGPIEKSPSGIEPPHRNIPRPSLWRCSTLRDAEPPDEVSRDASEQRSHLLLAGNVKAGATRLLGQSMQACSGQQTLGAILKRFETG